MSHDLSATGSGSAAASILIVDDEEALQSSLVTAFTLEGYRAVGAGSGGEALSRLQESAWDILLVDLRLPDIDGIQLLEQVREMAPQSLTILMTGGATVETAVRALKGGAHDYVLKPFRLAEIFHIVKRAVEQQRLQHENVQLTELNRRLREIDQIKSNLLSAITHEFRTPLTIMGGWLDLLLGNQCGQLSAKQQESLTAVRMGTIRLGRLISNLLAFVESDQGRLLGKRVTLSLPELLQEIVAELAPECEERQVSVRVECTPELPLCLGDADRLRLLFFNLVQNAIKFNEAGGEVTVRVGPDGLSCLVGITNSRGEIPPERLPGLLEPFTQGDMSASRVANGLGLGLALARSITQAHRGQLTIQTGQGNGTTVLVRLPLTD